MKGTNKAVSTSRYIEILRDNGVTDELTDVHISSPDLIGDHYGSSVEYVTVNRKIGEPVELFVKHMIGNEGQSERLREMKVFEKESGFFNHILPELERLVKSITGSSTEYFLDQVPKCYFADEDTIVLENLVTQGFTTVNRIDRQDLKHAQLVMKNLAKFHAPSYVLLSKEVKPQNIRDKYPCLEERLWGEGNARMINEGLAPGLERAHKCITTYPSEGSDSALETITRLLEDISGAVRPVVATNEEDICNVITHGDCWTSNMMFLEDPLTKEPVRQIFVDFQMVRVGSPNLDIGQYLYTSTKHEVRQTEWKNLLKLYYDCLVENVARLRGQVKFTFEDFVADYKKKMLPGLIFGVAMGCAAQSSRDYGNLDEIEGDMFIHFQKIVAKWMESNPDIVKSNTKHVTNMIKEYNEYK